MSKFESRNNLPLGIKDLFVFLTKAGYRCYKPVCRTWNTAFVMRSKKNVLCILIRKNGIDFRLYEPYRDEITIHHRNKIAFTGGKIYRNHYNESNNLIILKVMSIATEFDREQTISTNINKQDGRSYLLNPRHQELRAKARQAYRDRWNISADDTPF